MSHLKLRWVPKPKMDMTGLPEALRSKMASEVAGSHLVRGKEVVAVTMTTSYDPRWTWASKPRPKLGDPGKWDYKTGHHTEEGAKKAAEAYVRSFASKREAAKFTPANLYRYANDYATRKENEGKGTTYPTFREAAKRFHCSYDKLEQAVEDFDVSDVEGASYFGVGIGVLVSGVGYGLHEKRGDHVLEAY